MRVFVTGVKGQLGYDVMNELEKQGLEGIGVDIDEMDISRNTNRQGKTTQTFFPETGAPCLQSNSSQYHTPIKRLQPASH